MSAYSRLGPSAMAAAARSSTLSSRSLAIASSAAGEGVVHDVDLGDQGRDQLAVGHAGAAVLQHREQHLGRVVRPFPGRRLAQFVQIHGVCLLGGRACDGGERVQPGPQHCQPAVAAPPTPATTPPAPGRSAPRRRAGRPARGRPAASPAPPAPAAAMIQASARRARTSWPRGRSGSPRAAPAAPACRRCRGRARGPPPTARPGPGRSAQAAVATRPQPIAVREPGPSPSASASRVPAGWRQRVTMSRPRVTAAMKE